MERANKSFLSNNQLRAAGTLLAALPSSACTNLSTRTHFVFHAPWARKENTLSPLTKHRQLAKSFSLLLRALWAAGSRPGREMRDALLQRGSVGSGPAPQKGPSTGTRRPKEQGEVAWRSLSHLFWLETQGYILWDNPDHWRGGGRDKSHLLTAKLITPCCDGSLDPRCATLFLICIKRGIHEQGQPQIRFTGHPTASLQIILSKGEDEIMASTNLKMTWLSNGSWFCQLLSFSPMLKLL